MGVSTPGSAQSPEERRRIERMKNKVLISLENAYGDYCVDIFIRADGTFGFEEYRRDPEDGGLWQCLHRHSQKVFTSEENALERARATVAWLKADGA